jgi:hypothetical protein
MVAQCVQVAGDEAAALNAFSQVISPAIAGA